MRDYFELEAAFAYINPRIWRRFQLRTTASFTELRRAVSDAFAWRRQHAWELAESAYRDRMLTRGAEDSGQSNGTRSGELAPILLPSSGPPGVQLYDFSDGWSVRVSIVRTVSLPEVFRRRLVAGERAAPIEDCGGVAGYQDCVTAASGKYRLENQRDRDFVAWVGEWDPAHFDLEGSREAFDR